jgi:anti-sigma B factor antagonist
MAVCRVTVEPLEDACLIRASGELDSSTAERLRAPLEAASADGVSALVDLAGVTFMDSAGLRVLLGAGRASDADEWPWFVVRPSLAVLRLIALAGAAKRLPLVAAQDGAREHERALVVPLRGEAPPDARRIAHP